MFRKFVTTVGRIYNFIMSVVVAALLTFGTWVCWGFYADAQIQKEFTQEGQRVSVTVVQAEQRQKSWRDIFSNTTYLTVRYQGADYPIRYVMDSTYVVEGDQVTLLYHPRYRAFRQLNGGLHMKRSTSTRKSRLIDWTTISTFSDEHRLLLLCLVLTTASFFLVAGILVTLLPLTFLQDLARLVLIIELAAATLFFTYDTWAYFQYYQKLRDNGHRITVRVRDTDRTARYRNSRSSWQTYDYQARIQDRGQEQIIPISSNDFDRLKPNDSLEVFYNESMNDSMSADFSPDYWQVLVPLFLGLITFVLMRKGISGSSKASTRQTLSRQ